MTFENYKIHLDRAEKPTYGMLDGFDFVPYTGHLMKNKLSAELRREPTEMLVAARHFFGSKLDREIGVAVPVVLRPSIESTLLKAAWLV